MISVSSGKFLNMGTLKPNPIFVMTHFSMIFYIIWHLIFLWNSRLSEHSGEPFEEVDVLCLAGETSPHHDGLEALPFNGPQLAVTRRWKDNTNSKPRTKQKGSEE